MLKPIGLAAAIVALVFLSSISACSQGTAFTYQGKLTDSSVPANGTYPTRFALYDAATGGNVIAVEYPNITVINGIFTVTLDFGANRFDGNPRYLEINIDGNTLTPRQPINSAPYAIRSSKAAVADNANQLGGVNASQYVQTNDSRMTDARTPTANSPDYIQNRTTQQSTSNFNISDSGNANIFDAATQYNIGGQRFVRVNGSTAEPYSNTWVGVGSGPPSNSLNTANNSYFGYKAGGASLSGPGERNSFFGSNSGASNRSGSDNSFFGSGAGQMDNASVGNSFFGSGAGGQSSGGFSSYNSFFGKGAGGSTTTGGNNTFIGGSSGISNTTGSNNTTIGFNADVFTPFMGSTPTNATAIGANAFVYQSDSLVLGAPGVKVGIGTEAPFGLLHVVTPDDTSPTVISSWDSRHFVVGKEYTNGGIGMSYRAGIYRTGYIEAMQPNFAWGNLVLQSGGGNVGIGTGAPAPEQTLHVNGLEILSTGSGAGFKFRDRGSTSPTDDWVWYSSGNIARFFRTGVGDLLAVQTNGNVGIGTQSPISRLHLNDSSTNFAVTFTNASNTAGRRGYRLAFDTDRFSFQRADDAGNFVANQMVIDQASGNVGIGTTAPTYKLEINDPSNTGLRVLTNAAGGTVASFGGLGAFVIDTVSTVGGRFTVQEGGNVGIGTNGPAQKLDVQGDIRIGTSGTNGCLQNRSGGVIGGTCSSDLRFKRNITPFGSVLSSFSKLRPVNFYWRTDEFADKHFGPERSYGLIAQEVEQVFPDLVSIDEQGYKAVNYSKLPLLTIQAVKEQQTQIENQQKQIEQQRKQIESLTKIVCEIKSTADICRQ